MKLFNTHTHPGKIDLSVPFEGIINLSLNENTLLNFPERKEGTLYSIGLHPCDISESSYQEQLSLLETILDKHTVSAIGECGLDKICNENEAIQEEVFKSQIRMAEARKLPLIIHCVRSFDRLLKIRKEMQPSVPMIIHGYRGGEGLTKQLLEQKDLMFSIGQYYSLDSLLLIPSERLFIETDEAPLPLEEIYKKIAADRKIRVSELATQMENNKNKIFIATENH